MRITVTEKYNKTNVTINETLNKVSVAIRLTSKKEIATVKETFLNISAPIINEIPIGEVNGSNAIFSALNSFKPETLEVFLNGLKLRLLEDFNISGKNIQFNYSINIGEILQINYLKL